MVSQFSRLLPSFIIGGGNPYWNLIGCDRKDRFLLADEDLYLYKAKLNMNRKDMYRGVTCDFMNVHNS